MHVLQLFDDLWRDLDRLARMGAGPREMLLDAGVWAVATYRVGRALLSLPGPLRAPLLLLHRPLEMAMQRLTGVKLPLGAEIGGRPQFLAMCTPDVAKRVSAGDLVRVAAQTAGGGGGGRPELAQGGGTDASRLDAALLAALRLAEERLS